MYFTVEFISNCKFPIVFKNFVEFCYLAHKDKSKMIETNMTIILLSL